MSALALTVEVAGVLFVLQRRDELRLLPQEAVPVDRLEENVLLHLIMTQPCKLSICAEATLNDSKNIIPATFPSIRCHINVPIQTGTQSVRFTH